MLYMNIVGKGRIPIGLVQGELITIQRIRWRHLHKLPPHGYGLSVCVLNELSRRGVRYIKIVERFREGDKVATMIYRSSVNQFLEDGVLVEDVKGDPQRIVPLTALKGSRYWGSDTP